MDNTNRINDVLARAFGAGLHFYAFRSGGGLRVLSLGKEEKSQEAGYGEAANVLDALQYLCDDYEAGRRPYNEVYGGSQPHYLTGSSSPDSDLDKWILKGATVRAKQNDDATITVELRGWEHIEFPDDIIKAVIADGKPRPYINRSYEFLVKPYTFPGNGEAGVICPLVGGRKPPNNSNPTMWESTKTGSGSTFFDAVDNAFKAESVELE